MYILYNNQTHIMKDTKTYYVYELRNSENQVEYVGYTTKITGTRNRFYQHTRVRPGHSGNGLFYGRTDITMYIVHETQSKKEALLLEGRLKLSYGLEWTERKPMHVSLRKRKLTKVQVREIISKYVPRKYTQQKLADEYGVSQSAIRNVLLYKTYLD